MTDSASPFVWILSSIHRCSYEEFEHGMFTKHLDVHLQSGPRSLLFEKLNVRRTSWRLAYHGISVRFPSPSLQGRS